MHNIISKSNQALISELKHTINSTDKQCITFFAGHFPMIYIDGDHTKRHAFMDIHLWGYFTLYTFSLACQLAKYCVDSGKNVKLLIMVDDLIGAPKDMEGKRKMNIWMRRASKKILAELHIPKELKEIAKSFQVLEYVVHQKRSFGMSPIISELSIILQALQNGKSSLNSCSLSYGGMLEDPQFFDSTTDYLISFVPGQCRGNICDGVLGLRKDLRSTHVFFPHIEQMGGILDMGSGYEKITTPMPVAEMYEKQLISIRHI